MKLAEWLKATNFTQADFGRLIGVGQPAVSLMLNGKKVPGVAMIAKIARVTDGHVTYSDWLKQVKEAQRETC